MTVAGPFGWIPEHDELIALGRFTWAAMQLEAAAERACEILVGGMWAQKGSVGQKVERVKGCYPNPTPGQSGMLDWLDNAVGALEVRHEALHAHLAGVWVEGVNGAEGELQSHLRNVSRDSLIRFTPEALLQREAQLRAVIGEGTDAEIAYLAEDPARP